MICYLSRHMKILEYDREISLNQLKQMRDLNRQYTQLEADEPELFPSYLSVGMCCEKVEPSRSFPYCNDY